MIFTSTKNQVLIQMKKLMLPRVIIKSKLIVCFFDSHLCFNKDITINLKN